ncbi:hypothetical protein AMECASPLE_006901 [Ameca splendens]|uniref:Uncharacterized protein n=1 Tax=Ameca splendens TaxID=208324 RepID=A0ABV0XZC9_9TELE
MCQVVELRAQWAPRGTLKCFRRAGLGIAPPPVSRGFFPGSVAQCVAWIRARSSPPAWPPASARLPSPETKDKAGTGPDSPRSTFISPSFSSFSCWIFCLFAPQ